MITMTIIHSDSEKQQDLEDIPVVQEYKNVFRPLKGLHPPLSDPFTITLEPGAAPIAKAPYGRDPAELAELKKQLEDLVEKGFI